MGTLATRQMKQEVKDCPFCGCFAYVTGRPHGEEYYLVQCINPQCHARLGKKYKSKTEAVRRWNARAKYTRAYWYRMGGENEFVRCSSCHGVAADVVGEQWLLSDFCPNCGAKMDKIGIVEGRTLREIRDNYKKRINSND